MTYSIRKIFTFAVAAILAAGCADEDLRQPDLREDDPVDVRLSLDVAPVTEHVIGTRSAFVDESTMEDGTIHDLWVLQFAGTDGTAPLREARYYSSYDPSQMFKLIASSVPNRVVLVANTFDDAIAFSHCVDLAEFMESFRAVRQEEDLTTVVGGKHSSLMSGYRDVILNEAGAEIDFELIRTICKVNVNITNTTAETGAKDIEIKKVTMRSVTSKSFFFNSYELPDRYPAKYEGDRIDYPGNEWTDGTGTGDTRSFTFYLPVNKSGTSDVPHNPLMRSACAPDGATYLSISGTYDDPEDPTMKRPVEFRLMLGASETDYNLLPNSKYDISVTIDDMSDAVLDSRQAEQGVVDFRSDEHANSYIINPTTVEGTWKSYRIPVAKCHDFWNTFDGYYKDAGNALMPGGYGWEVEIIWSEMPITYDTNFKWVKDEGTDYRDYFEFALPYGVEHGNMVIGLRRYLDAGHTQLSDVFTWSWHMWVTDYNPNAALHYAPQVDVDGNESRFAYCVPGGDVHRYPGADWKRGAKYDGCYIMDRNLGMLSMEHYAPKAKGFLLYWNGRKDPNNINQKQYPGPLGLISARVDNQADNILYCIQNPTKFIAGSEWSGEWRNNPEYAQAGLTWSDPKSRADETKSVFDPCPPGWRLPVKSAYNGLTSWAQDGKYCRTALIGNGLYIHGPTGITRFAWGVYNDFVYPGYTFFWCTDGFFSNGGSLASNLIGRPARCVSYPSVY